MLPRPKRLTKKKDFLTLALRGRSIFGMYATLRIVETKGRAEGKIGFIISTKIYKHAVDRNRTKRRLREVLRLLLPNVPPGINLLFIAKPEARDADYEKLVGDIRHMIAKIPEALLKPAKPSSRGVKHKTKFAGQKRPTQTAPVNQSSTSAVEHKK